MDGTLLGIAVIGSAVIFVAGATGKGKELCDALGGTYTPNLTQSDTCPGGSLANLFRSATRPSTQPTPPQPAPAPAKK